jgi:hypothetical protein
MAKADIADSKYCQACRQVKPCTEFYRDRTRPDGFSSRCKACDKAKNHRYWTETHYPQNRDEMIDRARRYKGRAGDRRYCWYTPEQKADICARYRAGMSLGQIAALYNRSTGGIRRIVRAAGIPMRYDKGGRPPQKGRGTEDSGK